ncbi:esterase [Alteromonadaceae bacterium Bs31]|nr:esterase [Alteromonadaceae bacterium Bs31]
MPLNARQAGTGKPVVLIHGLFGSLENLGGIARQLAKHYCVHSIDLPNHGRSPHSDETSLAQMAEQVYHWLQKQSFQHASFIGHSLGGKVAMELALDHPTCVDRLAVLDISPVHYDPHHHQVFQGLLAIRPDELNSRGQAEEILAQHVEEPAVRSFLLKNLARQGKGYGWRMNLNTLHKHYPQLVKGNRSGACFRGKTLFLKGGRSAYIQNSHHGEIVSRFPSAQFKIVADTGHWLHAEKPDLVTRLLLKFLAH